MSLIKAKLFNIPTLLLVGIHIIFTVYILIQVNNWLSLILFCTIPVYYSFNNKFTAINFKEVVLDSLSFLIGLSFTLWLQISYNLSPVTASSLTGVFVAFIPQTSFGIKPNYIRNLNHSKLAIYAGSFAGMSDITHISSIENLLFISLFGGIIYSILRNSFIGLGGKLGSIGFAAIFIHLIINGMT
jgi:hypothetical protein